MILKGNFSVKKPVDIPVDTEANGETSDYKKKALESIGGSMVFVEREQLYVDLEQDNSKPKES